MPSRTADGGRRRIRERGGLRTNSRARRSPGACSRDLWAGRRSRSSSVSQRYLGRRVWEPDWFTGPPGRDPDLQCRAAEGWRTIDSCALPSMTCPPSHLLSIERGLTGITVTQSASLDGLLDERLAHRRRAGENAAVEVCRRGPIPWPNSGPGSPEALAAWSVSGREIESATLSRVTAKPPLPVRTTLGGRSSPSQRGSRKVKR
jgi:hypothetical protein